MNAAWPKVTFDDAPLQIIDGDRGSNYPKQDEFHDEGHCLFLNTGNVTKSGFEFGNCQFITEQKDNLLRKGKLSREDVIMTTRGTIGNVGYFNRNVPFEHIRINSGMVIFRADREKLLPSFLYQYLRSEQFNKQVNALRSGAAQPQLPIRDIKVIELPLPSVDQQEAISELISKYDDLIENNKRQIELLEESARQLYREWFVRFRFPGHEHVKIIDGVPEGWIRTAADQAMDILSGGTPKTSVPDYWDGEIGFFTPKDTTDSVYVSTTEKTITALGLEKCASNLYPKNTLFITARGTVGNLNLAQKPMAMNQSCYALVGREPINQFYLYFAMQAGIQQVKSRAVGAVFDAIIKDTFKVIPFLIPSKGLVEEFTDFVQPILAQIDTLMMSTERLVQARDILLPKLMSGEVAV
jgi:type I restriction enzyme S subunit